MTDSPDISVVIPTFNRREIVLRTLKALFHQDLPAAEFEIIVVDDGSSDGTPNAIRCAATQSRIRVLEQEHSGPGAARNRGVQAAESELVLFLDDDMRCHCGLLRAHLEVHRQNQNVVGYGAIFADLSSPPSLALECFKREIGAFHLKHAADPRISWDEASCVFSNTSVPRKLLLEVDGFDESFQVREDLDLGVRLQAVGARSCYVSNAIAHQYYLKTSDDLLAEAERFAAADVRFASKYPDLRIPGHVWAILAERSWKARIRRVIASSPVMERMLFSPLCYLGERCISIAFLRNLGVRALQARRRIRWLRVVQRGCRLKP